VKWGEFKKLVEEAGAKDEDDIFWIDIHLEDELCINKDQDGWTIS